MRLGDLACPWHPDLTLDVCRPLHDGSGLDNPYWDEVKDRAKPGEPWDPGLQIERFSLTKFDQDREPYNPILNREDFVGRYAWTVTDPESVSFVALHCHRDGLVDPMAGTGYWGYLLAQLGVEVSSYDLNPPRDGDNHWHKEGGHWADVEQMDGVESVRKHPDRVLFLAWPPYSSSVGEEIVRAYEGLKVIFIGEGSGGCTGDEELYELLDSEWREVANHTPVQWYGLHDVIRVYERRTR
jgi:hypothetical protein